MSVDLKREFLNLLERDVEFRYTVAGYLGLSEVLKKLDSLMEEQDKIWREIKALREEQSKIWEELKSLRENQIKLWENQIKLWENQNRLWEEVKALREGQNKLWENQNRLWEEVRSLREGQNKLLENQNKIWEEIKALREGQNRLWENQNKLWEEVKSLREGQNKLWEEVKSLREGQNRLWRGQEALWMEVRRIRTTLDRFAISEEEEAWEVVGYRLRELGFDVKLDILSIEDFEMNIYGVSGDVCVLGEVTVRLGHTLVDELEGKINFLRNKKPELLKPKMIKVIYTMTTTPKAVEKAMEYGIWIVTARQECTPLKIHST
ncbi:MAG: hypothetical protein NDF58_03570 [archaeon YNP-LCB-024-027]|nr:hypothetical protein [Candidatus Culexarchaeum yellowstonense]